MTRLRHLVLIAMSLQTTQYFAARRYWFASLLVLALLVGNAVMVADRSSRRWLGALARIAAAFLLTWSLVSQALLLRLPDELADYRVVTRQLEDEGPPAAIMPDAGWIVAGLGRGTIDVFDNECLRRPPMCARVAASDRVALVTHYIAARRAKSEWLCWLTWCGRGRPGSNELDCVQPIQRVTSCQVAVRVRTSATA